MVAVVVATMVVVVVVAMVVVVVVVMGVVRVVVVVVLIPIPWPRRILCFVTDGVDINDGDYASTGSAVFPFHILLIVTVLSMTIMPRH